MSVGSSDVVRLASLFGDKQTRGAANSTTGQYSYPTCAHSSLLEHPQTSSTTMNGPYEVLREKRASLSDDQRHRLVEIIASKKELMDHSTGYQALKKKQEAWEHVAQEFNTCYPADEPRTVTQLKREWEYIRKR